MKRTGIHMTRLSRRSFFAGASALAAPYLMPASAAAETLTRDMLKTTRNNISAFRLNRWEDHFKDRKNDVIICDTKSFALQYWSEDGSISKIYPTSVPKSPELTKLGYTKIVRKREGPTWRTTPSQRERYPDWPEVIGPGPENPLGTHAMNLSWQYYLIHGTHDTRKIGRQSSDGCIGLYNFHIQELFELAKIGTQVKLI
jgi:L,D-transpeptidase ErfK/SrfK